RGLRHGPRRRRRESFGRAAPAHRHREGALARAVDPLARRSDERRRLRDRARGAHRDATRDGGPHHVDRRKPGLHREGRRSHPGPGARPSRRERDARGAPGATRPLFPDRGAAARRARGLGGRGGRAGVTSRANDARGEPQPLGFAIIRRLFSYTNRHAALRNVLFALVVVRALQLPALAWGIARVISGPIASADLVGTVLGVAGFLAFAAVTELCFVYRMRCALLLGERVVQDLRD